MGAFGGPNIVEDGLVFSTDAANQQSYISGSLTCNSIGPVNITGSLLGASGGQTSPIYNSDGAGSWLFDGTDDNIDFQYNADLELQEFSVEAWVNWNGTTGTGGIVEVMAGSTAGWFIGFFSSGGIKWYTQTPGWQALEASTPTADTWCQVVGTLATYGTSNNKKMYFNGVYDVQTTTSAVFSYSTSNVRIGYYDAAWEGKIASVKIYNRVLTPSEVLQNYTVTKERFGL